MDNIKVAIRSRPLIQREIDKSVDVKWFISNNTIKGKNSASYTFDYVFDMQTNNEEIYEKIGRPIVLEALKGFNGTIFAYGQSGSGKTTTMSGFKKQPGIMHLALLDIFKYMEQNPDREFLIHVSYMEIYNEKISDLIGTQMTNLRLKEDQDKQVVVDKLSEHVGTSIPEIIQIITVGDDRRHKAATKQNDRSSRSHCILRMILESRIKGDDEDVAVNVSHLNFVDLAGSERAGENSGARFKEGCAINKSLLALGRVIRVLSEGNTAGYAGTRDSKLTRILQNALGGNSKTAIICTISPTSEEETNSTLGFASRAKNITNKPLINEVITDKARLNRCKSDIRELQDLLAKTEADRDLKYQKHLLEIERLKRLISGAAPSFDTAAVPHDVRKKRRETWHPAGMKSQLPLTTLTETRFEPIYPNDNERNSVNHDVRKGILCNKEEPREEDCVFKIHDRKISFKEEVDERSEQSFSDGDDLEQELEEERMKNAFLNNENDTLRQKNSTLKIKIETLKTTREIELCEFQEFERESFESEKAQLIKALSELEDAKKQLEQQIYLKDKELDDLKHLYSSHGDDYAILEAQLRETTSKSQLYKNTVEDLNVELSELRDKQSFLDQQVGPLNECIREKNLEIEQYKIAVADFESNQNCSVVDRDEMQKIQVECLDMLQAKCDEIQEKNRSIGSLEMENKNLKDELERILEASRIFTSQETLVEDLKRSLLEVRLENQTLSNQVRDLSECIANEKEASSSELEYKNVELKCRTAEVDNKTSELEHVTSELQSKVNELDGLTANMQCKNYEMEHIVEIEEKKTQPQHASTEIQYKNQKLEHIISDIEERKSELQHTLTEIQHKNDELEHIISDIEERKSERQDTLSEIKHKTGELEHIISDIEERKSELQDTLTEIQHKNGELEHIISDIEKRKSERQDTLSDIQHKNGELEHISDIEERKSELQDTLTEIQYKNGELEHIISDIEEKNAALQCKNSELEHIACELKCKNTELEHTIAELECKEIELQCIVKELECKNSVMEHATTDLHKELDHGDSVLECSNRGFNNTTSKSGHGNISESVNSHENYQCNICNDLQEKNQLLEEEVKERMKELEKVNNEIQQLQTTVHRAETDNLLLQEKLDEIDDARVLMYELEQLQETNAENEEKIQQLQHTIESLSADKDSLVNTLTLQLEESKKECAELKTHYVNTKIRCEETEKQVEQMRSCFEDSEKRAEELDTKYMEQIAQLDDYRNQNGKLNENYGEIRSKYEESEKRVEELNNSCIEMRLKLTDSEKKFGQLNESYVEMKLKYEESEKAAAEFNCQTTEMTLKFKEREKLLSEECRRIEAQQLEHGNTVEEISQLRDEIEMLKSLQIETEKSAQKWENLFRKEEDSVQDKEKLLLELKSQLKQSEDLKSELDDKLLKTKQEFKEKAISIVSELQKNIGELEKEKSELTTEKCQLTDEIVTIRMEEEERRKKLEDEITELKSDKEKLLLELKSQLKQSEDLKSELDDKLLKTKQEFKEKAISIVSELQKNIGELEKEKSELTTEKCQLTDEIVSIRMEEEERRKKLEDEITELKSDKEKLLLDVKRSEDLTSELDDKLLKTKQEFKEKAITSISELQKNVVELQKEKSELTTEKCQLTDEIVSIRLAEEERRKKLEDEITELKSSSVTVKAFDEIVQMYKDQKTLTEKVAKYYKMEMIKKEEAIKERDNFKEELSELNDLKPKLDKIEELEKREVESQLTIFHLQSQITENEERFDGWRESVEMKNEEVSRLKTEIRRLQAGPDDTVCFNSAQSVRPKKQSPQVCDYFEKYGIPMMEKEIKSLKKWGEGLWDETAALKRDKKELESNLKLKEREIRRLKKRQDADGKENVPPHQRPRKQDLDDPDKSFDYLAALFGYDEDEEGAAGEEEVDPLEVAAQKCDQS